MDFLDPRKKRAYRIRLMVGYVLMAIVIGLGALILVYSAYGYSINTKTGGVVQNGLLFIDSKPGGADISLNGQAHQNTSARLVLPAGDYTLKLSRSGYRSWQRTFILSEHAISRYVYPLLFPVKPVSTTMQTYSSAPALVTQSPDNHWLLLQTPAQSTDKISFDEYDTTKPTATAQTITIPASVLTNANLPGSSLVAIEWSTDNKHLLLQHTYQGSNEFIILDRTDPSTSINVNKLFGFNPSQVALRNKKIDQLYIYDQTAQTLQVGDTAKATMAPSFLKHVLAFKSYGNNLLTYVTTSQVPAGQAQARIWDNGTTYPLYNFTVGSHYLIDAAQFQNHWYYIAGSDTDDRVNIFQDPLSKLKDPAIAKAAPVLALRVLGATKISFSNNSRFVEIEAGQNFGVYDFETQSRYQYNLKAPLVSSVHWMDGHRLIGESAGQVFVMDYDGINQQLVLPTVETDGGYFSDDYNHLFTLTPVPGDTSVRLNNVDMRAGVDLPKT